MSARTNIKPADVIVLDTPFAEMHITLQAVPQHARMRARQLVELLRTIRPKKESDTLLWLAQQLADEVAATLSELAGAAA